MAALIYGLISLVWLYFSLIRGAWRSAEEIITELATHGFSLKEKNLFLRRFKTNPGIRPAEVTIRPAYRLEPWRVEIKVKGAYNGYLAIGNRKPLLVRRNMTEMTLDYPSLNDLHILASDETTANMFLTDPIVYDHLTEFLIQLSGVTGWEIYFEPEQVRVLIRTYLFIPRQVAGWVESLFTAYHTKG